MNSPLQFYKFLSTRHVDSTMSGNFRFGNLNYYRLLEAATGNSQVGDREEGTVKNHLTFLDTSQVTAEQHQQLKESNFVRGELVGNNILSDLTSSSSINGFAFCFAAGDLKELRGIWTGYDACISIADPVALADRMYKTGSFSGGKPIAEYFHEPIVGEIVYGSTTSELFKDDPLVATGFLKRPAYANQREWRIFLRPLMPISTDALFLSVECEGLVEVVFNNKAGNSDENITKPKVDYEKSLVLAVSELDDYLRAHPGADVKELNERFYPRIVANYFGLREEHGVADEDLDGFIVEPFHNTGVAIAIDYYVGRFLSSLRGKNPNGTMGLKGDIEMGLYSVGR